MKSYFVLANDIIIEFKGRHFSQFPGGNTQWRSQVLPGWASRPPGRPK